jgi:phosphoadenosine phosphosulfate reductase
LKAEDQTNPLPEASATEVIAWALQTHAPRIAIAASFSMEDVAVIDMATRILPGIRVFALDTGRLHEETYECAEAVRRRYNLTITWLCPRQEAVEALETSQGLYSFRESVVARRACCGCRKVEPLGRALQGLTAWMTGMRREHGVTRHALGKIETDAMHGGIIKVNPLADWSQADLLAYTTEHNLPVHGLYSRGYTSIGCAPCTRPVSPGEEPRAGRWWWEQPEHKECGLHGR